jgi:hypothetical protein
MRGPRAILWSEEAAAMAEIARLEQARQVVWIDASIGGFGLN